MPCVVGADGDRDSMPVVVKEAMAMEVPVVVTEEVGLPELVTQACGRLVPPRDHRALAQALDEVLDAPPEVRVAWGRAGRERVRATSDLRVETRKLSALIAAAAP
jgi:glycosyltransferase involved in cell wall biosynthesis